MKKEWKFLSKAELLKAFGKRCKSFEPGCVVCKVWNRYDTLLQMEYEDICERMEIEKD